MNSVHETALPSIVRDDDFTVVVVGPVAVWFSYDTPVAFQVRGKDLVVRRNTWGPTTGKHLKRIGGTPADRVDTETFRQLWADQIGTALKV
jgi:hypothetical protein